MAVFAIHALFLLAFRSQLLFDPAAFTKAQAQSFHLPNLLN